MRSHGLSCKTHVKSLVKEVPMHILIVLQNSPGNGIHSSICFPEINFTDIKWSAYYKILWKLTKFFSVMFLSFKLLERKNKYCWREKRKNAFIYPTAFRISHCLKTALFNAARCWKSLTLFTLLIGNKKKMYRVAPCILQVQLVLGKILNKNALNVLV